MEGQEGTQQAHLVLAHKLFLLSHPDVQDIEKVRLREEVLTSVKADGNSSFSNDSLPIAVMYGSISISISKNCYCGLCRYGAVVRNPSCRFGVGIGSGPVGFDACEDRRGAEEA